MENLIGLIEREAAQARERPILGLCTARVTAIHDDGTYELDYLSMGSNDPSAPARVMMPMAGNGRGTYFMPEPGDEVIVGFELGDINLPIILGGVWNEEDLTPDQAQASTENNIRTIVSRSGHEVTFDDTPGAEKVLIKTKGGHQILLDDTPPGKVTLTSGGGSEIEILDAAGSMTIRAPLRLSLESPMISINASGTIQIQAPAGILLQTTGVPMFSAVIIDGKPFILHQHLPPVVPVPPPPKTGPVGP